MARIGSWRKGDFSTEFFENWVNREPMNEGWKAVHQSIFYDSKKDKWIHSYTDSYDKEFETKEEAKKYALKIRKLHPYGY